MKSTPAKFTLLAAVAITATSSALAAEAQSKPPQSQTTITTPVTLPQTTCPVMGGKINKKQYTDHNGKRIYVCCPGCIAVIDKDPTKYIKKLEDAGVTLDVAPPKGHAKDAHTGRKH